MPESVTWLVANNRVDEAERIVHQAAKMNGLAMPDRIFSSDEVELITVAAEDGATTSQHNDSKQTSRFMNCIREKFGNLKNRRKKDKDDKSAKYTILDVFRNRRLTIYAICTAFLWLVNKVITIMVIRPLDDPT